MFSSAMILMREITPAAMRRCTVVMSCEHAVDAEAHAQLAPVGSQVDVGGAALDGLRDDLVDELDDRRVFGGLVQGDDLGAFLAVLEGLRRLADDVFEAVQARDQRGDVIRRRDRDADLVAGHDRDVVDREHVRRVGHRHQQRALVGERHGNRLVALGDGRADEVGGGHVDAEDAEVEVVEPVALGQRARQRVLRERAVFEQHALGRRARDARALERVVDLLARGEAHVDDHVGEEALRGAAARGLGESRLLIGAGGPRDLRGPGGGRRLGVRLSAAERVELDVGAGQRVELEAGARDRVGVDVEPDVRCALGTELAVAGRGPLDGDHPLDAAVGLAVDPEDRVQVRVGLLGSSLIARAPRSRG